jgi:hypothetical protein
MKCLKRDCDEGMSFSTHFLFIAILTLKCSGGLDMLMTKIAGIILINHVVPFSHHLTLKLFFLYFGDFSNQRFKLSF